jgi:CBS domain-containing protein
MKKREPVKDIMTTNVFTVQENEKLARVIELFRKHKIRHLPVMSGKKNIRHDQQDRYQQANIWCSV